MSGKLRILLAEDQTILRESLKALIANEPDLEVVGEAGDGEEAVRLTLELRPAIVVMDVSMPGWTACRRLRRSSGCVPR